MSPPGARDKAQNGDDGPAEDRGLFKVASPDEVRQGAVRGAPARILIDLMPSLSTLASIDTR